MRRDRTISAYTVFLRAMRSKDLTNLSAAKSFEEELASLEPREIDAAKEPQIAPSDQEKEGDDA